MLPDLDALRALDAVVRFGGFAKAAARLHRVQSAVSYQVSKLENHLGLRLLDRQGYRVQLTPAGEAVLIEARRLLAAAEHLERVAAQYASGWEPKLTVIVDGILRLEPILAAFKTLSDERVPTRMQLKIEFLGGVQYRFEQEDADLMLVKDYVPRHGLQAQSLPDVDCVLCAATSHPLSALRRVMLGDLHEHVELSVQDSSEQGSDRHMFGGERVYFLSGFIAKKQALLMGLGFGWVPRALVSAELRDGSLREVRYIGGSRYSFTPQLVHRSSRPLGRTGTRLVELIRSQSQRPVVAAASGRPRAALKRR